MSTGPFRALAVEDDEVDREVLARTFRQRGERYRVEFARDAQEARHKLASGGWDCVLLDYRLPEGDTLSLFEDLFGETCARRPPVVMLTGMVSERVAADALKRGAQDYLSKAGLSPEALFDAVDRAIAIAAKERAREARQERKSAHGLPRPGGDRSTH